ncbi:MAG: hypothetical protein GY758_01070 [Fuerstiella sp.]|nr:hypothetical protein [Fuerstiella sp.]
MDDDFWTTTDPDTIEERLCLSWCINPHSINQAGALDWLFKRLRTVKAELAAQKIQTRKWQEMVKRNA